MTSFAAIITTYNRRDLLKRALESVLSQTRPAEEIIVVDNHSTDGTGDLVRQFQNRSVRYIHEANHGIIAHSRNVGLQAARSEWVCFLDDDDWWFPEKIATIARYADQADVLYHDLQTYKVARGRYSRRMTTRLMSRPVMRDLLHLGSAIATSGAAARRRCAMAVGGFSEDPELIGTEDFDLWLRISATSDRFCRVGHTLGAYSITNTSGSAASERQVIALEKVYLRNASALENATDRNEAAISLAYFVGCLRERMGQLRPARNQFRTAMKSRYARLRAKAFYKAALCEIRDVCG